MNRKKAFLLSAFAPFASAGNVAACKCAKETQAFRYAAKHSSLIFSGHLVRITDQKQTSAMGAYVIRVYKFVPDKIWRGAKTTTITLTSGNDNCDVTLAKGHYVIYTNPADDLNRCNRIIASSIEAETRKLNQAFTSKRFKKFQTAG